MALTLDQIYTIKAAIDYGSFSSAARHLGKAQSTVSTTIRNLEEEIGVELFARTGQKPVLTDAGKGILEHINVMVSHALRLEGKLSAYAVNIENDITLIIDCAIPYSFYAPIIKEFYQHFPYVNLHIKSLDIRDSIDQVSRQECELAILMTMPKYSEDIGFCRLGRLQLLEVVHPEHPLGKMRRVSFTDLGSYRQLVFSPHGHNLHTAEYMRSVNQLHIDDYSVLIKMILDQLGWSVLPRTIAADYVNKGQMVLLPIESYPHTLWEVHVDLIWNNRVALGAATIWLKEKLSGNALSKPMRDWVS